MTKEVAAATTRRNKQLFWFIFFCILFISAALRFIDLDSTPPSLFRDEAEKGYTTYQLLHTMRHAIPGQDGLTISNPFPLFIEVYEGQDRISALYHYLSIVPVKAGGLSVSSTRFVAFLAGLLLVPALFWLAFEVLGKNAALVVAAFAGLQPTGILFSRWAQQGILVPLFLILTLAALARAVSESCKERGAWFLLASIFSVLSMYAYAPARVAVPLILGVLFLFSFGTFCRAVSWKQILLPGMIFLGGFLSLFVYTLTAGSSRLDQVSIFSSGPADMITTLVGNLFSHISPDFLFLNGDSNPRHSLPGCGFFGWGEGIAMAVLIPLAAYYFGVNSKSRKLKPLIFGAVFFMVLWIPASMTIEGIPHALRSIHALVIGPFAAGLLFKLLNSGIYSLDTRNVSIIFTLFAAFQALQVSRGVVQLSNSPPAIWQAGTVSLIEYATENGPPDGQIKVSNQIPYADYLALFAEKTSPHEYFEEGLGALRSEIGHISFPNDLKVGDAAIMPPPPGLPKIEAYQYSAILLILAEGGPVLFLPEDL